MSKVFTVANHSPEQLISWCMSLGLADIDDFTIVPFGKKLSAKKAKSYNKNIILLNLRCALNNAKFFSDKKFSNRNFFLFVPPFRASEYSNAIALDFSNDESNPGMQFNMHGFQLERFHQENEGPVVRDKGDYKGKVIDKVKEVGSVLTPLMTLIYTLPNSVMQKRVTHAICTWIYENQDEETLDKIFDALRTEMTITQAKRDKFKALLLSETGEKVRGAMSVFREQYQAGVSANADQVGHKYGIQPYDLRYINNIVRKGETYKSQEKLTLKEFQKKELAKNDEVVEEVQDKETKPKPKTKKKLKIKGKKKVLKRKVKKKASK